MDPHLRDRNILDVIYALAIKHRLDDGVLDDGEDEEPDERAQPSPAANQNMPQLS
jgi:hypothetical protein